MKQLYQQKLRQSLTGTGSADLPQNATFQQEIHRWSTFCQDLKDKPSSIVDAFILVDPDYYPKIRETLHILLTMPMESVPCEHSFFWLEQNNNGRGQTKQTIIIAHSQRRTCWQGQNTKFDTVIEELVLCTCKLHFWHSIMYRHKHFKYGFKVWLVFLLDLCSLVWHLKFNIFVYMKTKQVKFCFKVCFPFPLTGFEIMNTRPYIRRSFYSFCYSLHDH